MLIGYRVVTGIFHKPIPKAQKNRFKTRKTESFFSLQSLSQPYHRHSHKATDLQVSTRLQVWKPSISRPRHETHLLHRCRDGAYRRHQGVWQVLVRRPRHEQDCCKLVRSLHLSHRECNHPPLILPII